MFIGSKAMMVLVCAAFTSFSVALAEDLHIVVDGSVDVEAVVALEGVSVHAIMKGGLFVGTIHTGLRNLAIEGYSTESIGD